jgi:hypothetical protein
MLNKTRRRAFSAIFALVFSPLTALYAQKPVGKPSALTPLGESFMEFMDETQRNIGYGRPDVALAVVAQVLGLKNIPHDWDYEVLRSRVERDLRKRNIEVIQGCTAGNCGALAIHINAHCGDAGFCVFCVSAEFQTQVKPLRLPNLTPISAAVWTAPNYDYGVVRTNDLGNALSRVDEIAELFSNYYMVGSEKR